MGRHKQMKGKPTQLIGKKGALADLHTILHNSGFSFEKEIGGWKEPERMLVYRKGNQTIRMVRIKRGELELRKG